MLFCIQLSFIWLIITKCLTLSEPAVLHSQYLYQSAESEECSSTDYKYVLLNNFCKNIKHALEKKLLDSLVHRNQRQPVKSASKPFKRLINDSADVIRDLEIVAIGHIIHTGAIPLQLLFL